jgi:uncharacterized protein
MKTISINTMKTVMTSVLAIVILTGTSCNTNQRDMTKEKEQSQVSNVKVNPPDMDIHTAIVMGNLEAVRQHIKAGTDLNLKEPAGGSTPLITAVVFGKTEIALALIEAGADLNLKNNDGSTALHSAAFFCRIEIVKALLEKGADKNVRNNYGSTPLETVEAPFNDVKGIYDQIGRDLGPLGFKLDYARIEKTRPIIADMLR